MATLEQVGRRAALRVQRFQRFVVRLPLCRIVGGFHSDDIHSLRPCSFHLFLPHWPEKFRRIATMREPTLLLAPPFQERSRSPIPLLPRPPNHESTIMRNYLCRRV